MKITLCGSIAFHDEMLDVQLILERRGHEIKLPPTQIMNEDGTLIPVKEYYELRKKETSDVGWIWDKKQEAMMNHFKKVDWSDAVLILNYDKNDIKGYIGANTLLEMGLAMYLNKPIYLLNEVPDISYKEEILGMKPIVLFGDLNKLDV